MTAQLKTKAPDHAAKVLILGTGIAGLTAALKLADSLRVILVSKGSVREGTTRYAQGGIAAVWSTKDSFSEHREDTLNAGGGLCRSEIVDFCVEEGPARVEELIGWGVPFSKVEPDQKDTKVFHDPAEEFDLHREGGHRKRRILHAKDKTGLAIQETLLERIASHSNIEVYENWIAVDLITDRRWRKSSKDHVSCYGVYALDTVSGKVHSITADMTVLATGGAGKAYLYTSNPDTATGDGIAMAARAGARVANMEFIQFHPTCLYHPAAKNFLISEALRGEGAILCDSKGKPFMDQYHEMGSLAPRDVVARAIDMEMKRTGEKSVYLDTSTIRNGIEDRFPGIASRCLEFGVDIKKDPIPVVPAAHYTCGGVLVDEHGQTSISHLYAVGETACTGLHGANRLASNSLLEGVVYSHRVAKHISENISGVQTKEVIPESILNWETGLAVEIEEKIDIAALWFEIRHLMWNYVGIVRSNRRLEKAKRRLDLLSEEVNEYYWDYLLTKDFVELRNLVSVAKMIVTSAMWRKESRGLHFNVDYPSRDDRFFQTDTVL